MDMTQTTKQEFSMQEKLKIQQLQIELEKYRCSKINSLAAKAKNNKDLRKAKVYYRAWGSRMTLACNLQKEHKKLVSQLEKEKKNVLSINSKTKSLSKPRARNLEPIADNLRQVC